MIPVARLTDSHSCPLPGHGTTPVNSSSGDVHFNFLGSARVGDVCGCGAVITTGFPTINVNVNGRPLAHLGSPTSHGGVITSGSPDSVGGFQGGSPGPIVNFAMLGAIRADGSVNEVRMNQLMADSANTALMARQVGALVEENDCVFAKSCLVPIDSTEAGTGVEPASNFGRTVVLGSIAMPASAGSGVVLGHIAGQATIAEAVGAWSLRGAAAAAGTAASTLLLALWSSSLGDSTLTEEQLRSMTNAPTRVRFQFRRDAEGVMRVYGIHTSATSGEDRVPVVQAVWNAERTEMQAHVSGSTITWTPNSGPVVQAPTTYPGATYDEIQFALKNAPSVAIPQNVHQKNSETYGWRNSKTQQEKDAANLERAVNQNLDAIKPYLLQEGYAEVEIEKAREKLHKLHREQGWY